MPVAIKQPTLGGDKTGDETTIVQAVNNLTFNVRSKPLLPAPFGLMEEAARLLRDLDRSKAKQLDYEKKLELQEGRLVLAQETISKARLKKESSAKSLAHLQESLEVKRLRVEQALSYWRDFGLDVRDADDCYEFIFELSNSQRCVLGLSKGNKLEITRQEPALLSDDQLVRLVNEINATEEGGNYRKAALAIKKALLENINSQTLPAPGTLDP